MLSRQLVEYLKLGTGGSYSLSRDAIKHQIWDTRSFEENITSFTYFMQPLGSPWRAGNKTVNEINISDSGKLPNGQTMLFTHIGVHLQTYLQAASTAAATVAQAFINLMHSSVFEIQLAGRSFDFQVHGKQFLPGPISLSGATATDIASVRMGDTHASGWQKLDPAPIFIDQLVSFNVVQTLQNPDPAVDAILDANSSLLKGIYATMSVTLVGYLTRAK